MGTAGQGPGGEGQAHPDSDAPTVTCTVSCPNPPPTPTATPDTNTTLARTCSDAGLLETVLALALPLLALRLAVRALLGGLGGSLRLLRLGCGGVAEQLGRVLRAPAP